MAHLNEPQSEQSASADYYDGCEQTSCSQTKFTDTTASGVHVELDIMGTLYGHNGFYLTKKCCSCPVTDIHAEPYVAQCSFFSF